MSRPAPPGEPAARGPALRGAGRALLEAGSGGTAAFLWIAVASQLLALLAFLLAGVGEVLTWARGGLLLTVLSLRAEVTATIPGLPGLRMPTAPVDVSLVFVPMLLTLAFVWLAGRAGRRAADQRLGEGRVLTAALAAAGAAVPAAALAALAAAAARLSVPTLSLELAGDPASAARWGFVVAAVAAGTGAALRTAGPSSAGRVVRGGLAAYGWAIVLLVVGVVAIAALEPRVTRGYVRLLGDAGPIAPAALGLHVLALPAQSAVLLAPASGSCVEVVLGSPALTLCPWRLDPGSLGTAIAPSRIALSPWLWTLSAVPPIAAFLGGRRAALAEAGRRAIGLGAAAGLVFAATSVLCLWFATPRVEDGRALFFLPLALAVDPFGFVATAAAWGIVGGVVGGWIESRSRGERL